MFEFTITFKLAKYSFYIERFDTNPSISPFGSSEWDGDAQLFYLGKLRIISDIRSSRRKGKHYDNTNNIIKVRRSSEE